MGSSVGQESSLLGSLGFRHVEHHFDIRAEVIISSHDFQPLTAAIGDANGFHVFLGGVVFQGVAHMLTL